MSPHLDGDGLCLLVVLLLLDDRELLPGGPDCGHPGLHGCGDLDTLGLLADEEVVAGDGPLLLLGLSWRRAHRPEVPLLVVGL